MTVRTQTTRAAWSGITRASLPTVSMIRSAREKQGEGVGPGDGVNLPTRPDSQKVFLQASDIVIHDKYHKREQQRDTGLDDNAFNLDRDLPPEDPLDDDEH